MDNDALAILVNMTMVIMGMWFAVIIGYKMGYKDGYRDCGNGLESKE